MLQDHGRAVERWAAERRERTKMASAFGGFIADLALWDWFINPFSFRVEPVPDAAVTRIEEFFALVQREAVPAIGWIIAEEFGRLGGRYHCHALVTGVANLRREFWWREAFRRFGRTRIGPFDPKRGAAFYAAKYAAKQLGGLHFGGTLAGINLSLSELPTAAGGRQDTVLSADLPRTFYRLGLRRWHR